jgi:tRNA threonylcarbamoyladenosine biosynthesis protein TsaE
MSERLTIASGAAMQALGAALATALAPGDVVLLHGDLGAGKTTLAQGLTAALGSERPAQSPTFTFATTHTLPAAVRGIARVHHLDLYRLTDPAELEGIGWDAYLADPGAVTIVEWPERAGPWLPDEAWVVEIAYAGPDRREVALGARPPGARGAAVAAIAAAVAEPS